MSSWRFHLIIQLLSSIARLRYQTHKSKSPEQQRNKLFGNLLIFHGPNSSIQQRNTLNKSKFLMTAAPFKIEMNWMVWNPSFVGMKCIAEKLCHNKEQQRSKLVSFGFVSFVKSNWMSKAFTFLCFLVLISNGKKSILNNLQWSWLFLTEFCNPALLQHFIFFIYFFWWRNILGDIFSEN